MPVAPRSMPRYRWCSSSIAVPWVAPHCTARRRQSRSATGCSMSRSARCPPLGLPFDAGYYLGVTVGADAEMTPREAVLASPYARQAASAEALAASATVGGAQITGSISTATLPAGNLNGTIGTAQIANNAVTQAKLSPSSGAAAGKVLGTDGSNLQWQSVGSGSGTVTSVGTGTGLSGGPITTTGTINLVATQLLPRHGLSPPTRFRSGAAARGPARRTPPARWVAHSCRAATPWAAASRPGSAPPTTMRWR